MNKYSRIIIIFSLIYLLVSCKGNNIIQSEKYIVIGVHANSDNFAFGITNNKKILFYEWNFEQNQWERNSKSAFSLPNGYQNAFSFGPDMYYLAVELKNQVKFFELGKNGWVKLYQKGNMGKNRGKIVGTYDFSLPKDTEIVYTHAYEIWIRRKTEITVMNYDDNLEYDEAASDYIFNPKWEEPYITPVEYGPKILYDLSIFSDYDKFVNWGDLGCVGTIKNNGLDFYEPAFANDPVYFKTYKLIPNSNFILPENFSNVFSAGRGSIGVIANNQIKFYSALINRNEYGEINRWEGWKYLNNMDFKLNTK